MKKAGIRWWIPTFTPPQSASLTAPLREGSQNKSLHEVAQHVLEDAAVTVVVGLTGRVDADHRVELGLGAVLVVAVTWTVLGSRPR